MLLSRSIERFAGTVQGEIRHRTNAHNLNVVSVGYEVDTLGLLLATVVTRGWPYLHPGEPNAREVALNAPTATLLLANNEAVDDISTYVINGSPDSRGSVTIHGEDACETYGSVVVLGDEYESATIHVPPYSKEVKDIGKVLMDSVLGIQGVDSLTEIAQLMRPEQLQHA